MTFGYTGSHMDLGLKGQRSKVKVRVRVTVTVQQSDVVLNSMSAFGLMTLSPTLCTSLDRYDFTAYLVNRHPWN